jgi:threonine dehydrogenase-like Zn-dependent dehydrogenase
MPVADIIRREITVHGTFCYTQANVIEAVGLLAQHAIRLDPWVTEAPLADGGLWFDRLIDSISTAAKVLLIPTSL